MTAAPVRGAAWRVLRRARRMTRELSPGQVRARRFLAGLPLDPDAGPPPAPPGPRDFLVCGCPRTGTALLTAALFQPPRTVTVMEPWDGMRMPPAELFASLRRELAGTGELRRGRLDLQALAGDGAVRWCADGATPVAVDSDERTLLGVKWPVYWRYLEHFPDTKFLVCVRDPAEVMLSFQQAGGRLARGLDYPTRFNAAMNAELRGATRRPALRRVLLYDYVNSRLLPFLDRPNVFVVRYERWFEDPDALLSDLGAFLGAELGDSPVRVRRRARQATVSPRDRRLLRRHCRTAEPLGYAL